MKTTRLMPLTLAHATARLASAPHTIAHRGTRRARLERFHAKVARFNLLRVVELGENWNA